MGSGPFNAYKVVVTKGATGKFKVGIKQENNKSNCLRVTVPAPAKYRMTVKNIGCISLN